MCVVWCGAGCTVVVVFTVRLLALRPRSLVMSVGFVSRVTVWRGAWRRPNAIFVFVFVFVFGVDGGSGLVDGHDVVLVAAVVVGECSVVEDVLVDDVLLGFICRCLVCLMKSDNVVGRWMNWGKGGGVDIALHI